MMNYSKNTKRNIKAFAALCAIALMAVLTVLIVSACTHQTTATDVVEISGQKETNSPAPATPEATEPVTEPEQEEPVEPEFVSLGEFRNTAYCGCSICCGKYGENRPLDENGKPIVYTANGTVAVEGVTIAADINVLPYGTSLYINGHQYIVQDRGGVINGNRLDIYFENHQDALNFGVQYKEVFVEREVKPND